MFVRDHGDDLAKEGASVNVNCSTGITLSSLLLGWLQVDNIYVVPSVLEIFGDNSAMTLVWFVFAA